MRCKAQDLSCCWRYYLVSNCSEGQVAGYLFPGSSGSSTASLVTFEILLASPALCLEISWPLGVSDAHVPFSFSSSAVATFCFHSLNMLSLFSP